MSALAEAIELSKSLDGAEVAVTDPTLGDELPHAVHWDVESQAAIISGSLPKGPSGRFVMSNGELSPLPLQK